MRYSKVTGLVKEKYCPDCDRTRAIEHFGRAGEPGQDRTSLLYYTVRCKDCRKLQLRLLKQDPYAEYKTCIKCKREHVCIEFPSASTPLTCGYCLKEVNTEKFSKPERKATHKAYYARPEAAKKKADWMRAYMKKQAAELTDTYIKIMISGSHRIPFKEITQEMIELKRVTLLGKRVLRDLSNIQKIDALVDNNDSKQVNQVT